MNSEHENRKCILDIETTDFIPWNDSRIICIGIRDTNSHAIPVFYHDHEETLILRFLQYFNRKQFQEIIGYNVPYDIRFIFSRCLKYQIPAPEFLNAVNTDIMKILKWLNGGYNYNKPGTLNQWASYLLGEQKLYNNRQIPQLYLDGKIREIIEYNRKDVELTYKLWQRIQQVFGDVDNGKKQIYGEP